MRSGADDVRDDPTAPIMGEGLSIVLRDALNKENQRRRVAAVRNEPEALPDRIPQIHIAPHAFVDAVRRAEATLNERRDATVQEDEVRFPAEDPPNKATFDAFQKAAGEDRRPIRVRERTAS